MNCWGCSQISTQRAPKIVGLHLILLPIFPINTAPHQPPTRFIQHHHQIDQLILSSSQQTNLKMCEDDCKMSPAEFCDYMSERSIKDQNDRLFKFILRKAYKYAGRNDADPKPKKYRKYVHMAGAQAVKLRQDCDEGGHDGFGKIRKMYHQNKDDYPNIDAMLTKAQEELDAKIAAKGDDAEEDEEAESSGAEDDCWSSSS